MKKAKILVVEDERVVATDIEESLRGLGYAVVGAAASGVSAIRRAVETEPDLVLMDIKLKGAMDGVDAAGEVHDRLGIPVVFLTAYADEEILDRAKLTSPSGYVLKPFDERALRSAVEIALHRHPEERNLAEREHRLVTALRSFGEAVILTCNDGRVTFMNRVAERLTGWKQAEAVDRPVSEIFTTIHSRMGSLVKDPVARALREGTALGLGDQTTLISRQGTEAWIEGNVTPLRDEDGEIVGAALAFRGIDTYKVREHTLAGRHSAAKQLETMNRVAEGVAAELAEILERVAASVEQAGGGHRASTETEPDRDHVRAATQRGQRLAKALLEVSQRRPARSRVVELNEVVTGLEPLLSYAVGRESEIETRLRPKAGKVKADPVRLRQLVLEMLGEARYRMPSGGRITLETDGVELLGEYAQAHTSIEAGNYAVVSISFAGSEILPSSDNVGRALPAVCSQLRKLGGDILVRNEPGRRTSYEIYLPQVGGATQRSHR